MALKLKIINEVVTDLALKAVGSGTPFQPGMTAIAFSGAGTPTIKVSDDNVTFVDATTPAAMVANTAAEITLKRYIKLNAAGTAFLLASI